MSASTSRPKFSIFTHSLAYHSSGHSLLSKLASAAVAGLETVELFTDDLWELAQSDEFDALIPHYLPTALLTPPDSPLASPASLAGSSKKKERFYSAMGECTREESERELAAAQYVRRYCDDLGLEVYCLQPIRDIEGHLDPQRRRDAMERVRSRFPIMRALGAHLLLICSSNARASSITADLETLVGDFREISALVSEYTECTGFEVKIGFEALSWGTHIDIWSQAWQVVEAVERDNVGLVLDSFNTLAREYADPCEPSFIQQPHSHTLSRLSQSLHDITQIPWSKIFLLQIGDAKRLPHPLLPSPREGEERPARMIWSRSSRLYPCEEERGAFMPVKQFVSAVIKAGYTGPWSIEVFNDSLASTEQTTAETHAMRAFTGLQSLYNSLSL